MKAVLIHSSEPRGKVTVEKVPDPKCTDNGVIVKVAANGICRSDWHEWNSDWTWIGLVAAKYPIIPGHEGSGTIVEVGKNVKKWKVAGSKPPQLVEVHGPKVPRVLFWLVAFARDWLEQP